MKVTRDAFLNFWCKKAVYNLLDTSVYSYEGNTECDLGYGGGQAQASPDGNDDSFIVKLHCPGLTSMKWIVKLYSLVLGGLGVILSFTWICFHLYVLSVTSLAELRQHRLVQVLKVVKKTEGELISYFNSLLCFIDLE